MSNEMWPYSGSLSNPEPDLPVDAVCIVYKGLQYDVTISFIKLSIHCCQQTGQILQTWVKKWSCDMYV